MLRNSSPTRSSEGEFQELEKIQMPFYVFAVHWAETCIYAINQQGT